MTRALPFTEHSLRRAIAAVRKEGLRVAGIRADGTLILAEAAAVDGEDNIDRLLVNLVPDGHVAAPSKWKDA